jgi:hypothetical protein
VPLGCCPLVQKWHSPLVQKHALTAITEHSAVNHISEDAAKYRMVLTLSGCWSAAR